MELQEKEAQKDQSIQEICSERTYNEKMMMMMMMMNCFCGMVDRRKAFLALFPAGTTVRDPHHLESLTRREQDLNLCRT